MFFLNATRTLIQLGGLIHKSGLMQKVNLDMGDDLQDPKHILKAAQIFGFLIKSLEYVSCDLKAWQALGAQHLKRSNSPSQEYCPCLKHL